MSQTIEENATQGAPAEPERTFIQELGRLTAYLGASRVDWLLLQNYFQKAK